MFDFWKGKNDKIEQLKHRKTENPEKRENPKNWNAEVTQESEKQTARIWMSRHKYKVWDRNSFMKPKVWYSHFW